jgi:putative ABC transport system substrate-binding protein
MSRESEMAIRRLTIGCMIGLALLLPPAMAEQPLRITKVGVLVSSISSTAQQQWLKPFEQALREHGWVEGRNIQFEYREPSGHPLGFSEPVAELVKLRVDVLFCIGAAAVRAAVEGAGDIPIVAHDLVTEPVAAGYARSYARPGGNLTGVFFDTPQLAGKWLELLTLWRAGRKDPEWRASGRLTHRAADEIRACGKPQGRSGSALDSSRYGSTEGR